jgi:type VI secretion system protein ImpA
MLISDELLVPIPGTNPCGVSLRYDPVYDRIKEARREEDDVPQGDWKIEIKKADWAQVLKLCSESLASKSKDLQLAAWLTEALMRREGFAGLRQGLGLCRNLLEQFWESLYPQPEEDDLELRAAPLDWVGGRLAQELKNVPLTTTGLDWFKYKESRAVGYEEEASQSDAKREARAQAISDGKITAEDFDKAVAASPKAFFEQSRADLEGCLEALTSLSQVCDSRFGDFRPSFAALREALEEIQQLTRMLLTKRLEQEPEQRAAADQSVAGEQPTAGIEAEGVSAFARGKKERAGEPASRDDAYDLVIAVARFLRKEDLRNVVPYLLLRALRWGEVRASGSELDTGILEAPPTEIRTQIKKLASEGSWEPLLDLAEEAMARPCGRGWLDLQRYICKACEEAGCENARNAVVAELKGLLTDYPNLPKAMLLDDTPTANAETQAWLETILPPEIESAREEGRGAETERREPLPEVAQAETRAEPEPDALELAKRAKREGRANEAIEILSREIAREQCGRARFQAKLQLADFCLSSGYESVAHPVLEELAAEIEQRKLEEWEPPATLAHALVLLFRCLDKLKQEERKQKVYAQICRLDPVQAIGLHR